MDTLIDPHDWAASEFGHAAIPDARNVARLVQMAQRVAARPLPRSPRSSRRPRSWRPPSTSWRTSASARRRWWPAASAPPRVGPEASRASSSPSTRSCSPCPTPTPRAAWARSASARPARAA
nr:hypothetical protein [Deltaproteobacteria bacterium]